MAKNLRATLALSGLSLVAFSIGMACLAAAVLTGAIYQAQSVLDWQAIQLWRIQWLLAAVVALLAGLLLKQKRPQSD